MKHGSRRLHLIKASAIRVAIFGIPVLRPVKVEAPALFRFVSFDEGGRPSNMNDDLRSYIPGKPHPNMLQWLCSVDSDNMVRE